VETKKREGEHGEKKTIIMSEKRKKKKLTIARSEAHKITRGGERKNWEKVPCRVRDLEWRAGGFTCREKLKKRTKGVNVQAGGGRGRFLGKEKWKSQCKCAFAKLGL